MQYFISLVDFTDKFLFSLSMMVHFKKCLGKNTINEINVMITNPRHDESDRKPLQDKRISQEKQSKKTDTPDENQWKLFPNTTSAPADIHFLTYVVAQ